MARGIAVLDWMALKQIQDISKGEGGGRGGGGGVVGLHVACKAHIYGGGSLGASPQKKIWDFSPPPNTN